MTVLLKVRDISAIPKEDRRSVAWVSDSIHGRSASTKTKQNRTEQSSVFVQHTHFSSPFSLTSEYQQLCLSAMAVGIRDSTLGHRDQRVTVEAVLYS